MASDGQLVEQLKELKQRLQVLEDKEAIRDLLVHYSFNADLNRIDAFVNLWTEDATFDAGAEFGGLWKHRDQIKQLMNGPAHQSIANRSQHLMLDFMINVDGDVATAAGYVLVTVHWQGGFGIYRCSLRTFRFKRIEGTWRIQQAVSRAAGDAQCHSLIPPNL